MHSPHLPRAAFITKAKQRQVSMQALKQDGPSLSKPISANLVIQHKTDITIVPISSSYHED